MNPLKELKYNLGQLDALISFNKLLLIEFDEIADKSSGKLSEIAKKNNIRIDFFDFGALKKLIYRSHITNIHSHFEIYLDKINSKAKKYVNGWKEKDDKEDTLTSVYNNVFLHSQRSKTNLLKRICDYYRLIRNKIVHRTDEKLFFDYSKFTCDDNLYQIINEALPSRYEEISYNDCVLYTRAIKLLADEIYSNIKYDLDKIVNNFNLNNVVSSKTIDKKLISIKTQLRMEFNLDPEYLNLVTDKIICRMG